MLNILENRGDADNKEILADAMAEFKNEFEKLVHTYF
jgi:hypothetical protein